MCRFAGDPIWDPEERLAVILEHVSDNSDAISVVSVESGAFSKVSSLSSKSSIVPLISRAIERFAVTITYETELQEMYQIALVKKHSRPFYTESYTASGEILP